MKKVDSIMEGVSSKLKSLQRQQTIGASVKSRQSASSRVSDGGGAAAQGMSVKTRAASQLRSLWTANDHAVCKIIAVLAKSRM